MSYLWLHLLSFRVSRSTSITDVIVTRAVSAVAECLYLRYVTSDVRY